ncbi:hypothetical protein HAX54_052243, partial [Datura stramonium]|nr:hypothetical protein [Datura stramonium]
RFSGGARYRPEKDREQQIGQGSSDNQNRSEQIARSNSRRFQSRARERLSATEQPTIASAAAEFFQNERRPFRALSDCAQHCRHREPPPVPICERHRSRRRST